MAAGASSDAEASGEKATDAAPLTGSHLEANGLPPSRKRTRQEDHSDNGKDMTTCSNAIKRSRSTPNAESAELSPSVQVTYEQLNRESKAKLMELLKYWAQWQAQSQPATDASTESGTVIYFPPDSSSGSFFWVDKPRVPQEYLSSHPEASMKDFSIQYEQDSEVPLYDRSTNAPIDSEGEEGNGLGDGVYLRIEKDAPRCWNCASYTHAARDCPKPRDQQAFNAARDEFQAKRGIRPGETSQRRYFEGGLYDDLKPGQLTAPLREALGIESDDPPPWLHRMRELGYPPAYLASGDGSESPSGIEVFGLDDGQDLEGPDTPSADLSTTPAADVSRAIPRELVAFPGVNAPIPEGADPRKWENRFQEREGFRNWSGHDWQASGAAYVAQTTSVAVCEGQGVMVTQGSYGWDYQQGHAAAPGAPAAGQFWQGLGPPGEVPGRGSRWDSQEPQASDVSRSWPGASILGGFMEQPPGVESDFARNDLGGGHGLENGREEEGGGGEADMDLGGDDFPPGYSAEQQSRGSPTYAYQHGSAAQEGAPSGYEPPPSYSPSPPPPPSYDPSPPPPPLLPGYDHAREITPPPYQTYGSPHGSYASPTIPESYHTPQQHFSPAAHGQWQPPQQPRPSGPAANGWNQTWSGFWP